MADDVCKFVWYELTTSDLDAAQAFYSKVIAWNIVDAGMPAYRYGIVSAGTISVGGMMAINDEMKARGVPPCWTGYVGVPDVDAKTAQFKAAGGSIHLPPADIPGVGRFSIVADPFGAVLVLFKPQGGQSLAPVARGTPGHFGWNELMAGEREAAFDFYAAMFGWTMTTTHDMGPMGLYQLFATGGAENAGGMMTKFADMQMSFWAYYINVDSINAATERVKANGGTIINGPMEVPGGDWVVQCQDPQGAFFSLVGPK
jgi:uncharacterized protein